MSPHSSDSDMPANIVAGSKDMECATSHADNIDTAIDPVKEKKMMRKFDVCLSAHGSP